MNLLEKYRARLDDARRGEDDMPAFLWGLDDEDRFSFEERAAIMEYDGGLRREEAERLARASLVKPVNLPLSGG